MNQLVTHHSSNGSWSLHMAEVAGCKVECEVRRGKDGEAALLGTTTTVSAKPTRAEVRSHHFTHQPYTGWCRWCVLGKAHDSRRRVENSVGASPVALVDCMYFVGNKTGTIPVLLGHDDHTRRVGAWLAPSKGVASHVSHRFV